VSRLSPRGASESAPPEPTWVYGFWRGAAMNLSDAQPTVSVVYKRRR
jgi:hypothetical protein